jgi:immune inhibitor A
VDKSEKLVLFVVIGSVIGCLLVSLLCGGIILISQRIVQTIPTNVPTIVQPTALIKIPSTPTQIPDQGRLLNAAETLNLLENTTIPTADLNSLAEKMEGKKNIPTHLDTPPHQYQVGETLNFYKLNLDTNENILTTATLRYANETVYFWAESNLALDKRELKRVMDTFSSEIYPTNQEFFGKEWLPGVDNDPHLYILYAGGLGGHLAGYTATNDVVLPIAHEYSNAHEMFTINSDVQSLTDLYTLSVMAHELQHLIHGYHDPNEELWLNEGFSELATLLNGYDSGGFDSIFSYDTDIQLNDWPADPGETDAHYGASFLYVTYLLDRFGEKITRAVVADPLNGFASIDNVFKENNLLDPLTGALTTSDGFFADWAITNFLLDSTVLDGRYHYSNYTDAPQADLTETVYDCNGDPQSRDVYQFGTDYIQIGCSGQIEISFQGDATVGVLPVITSERGSVMWSNRADTSDTTLTKEFDFSEVTGNISMKFDMWYDLETDYDYLYILASLDGSDWQIIDTPSCTTLDPSGNSYGCGYNGQSDAWLTERVDLSNYAGKKVTLRFEYVTDGAVTGEGFILDNLSIPPIGYSTNFEENEGGWVTDGFVRI